MAMISSSNISYERLKHESWFDEDNKEIRDKIIGKYLRKIRLSRVHIRRKRKIKVPSLMRFLKRKARLVKVALKKVYKRLKEGRSHFGDLFAGNYLFMQVTPTPLKYSENGKSFVKGKDQLHGFSPRYPVHRTIS